MIRPASEIQYPPSEAMCMKARMMTSLESLSKSSQGLNSAFEEELRLENHKYLKEIKAFNAQQEALLENMRRIIEGN